MTSDFDVFGDASLFDEFDKERDQSGSFCFYEKDESGIEDRSKILFQASDSSSSSSSEDESDDEVKVNKNIASTPVKAANSKRNGDENGLSEGEHLSEDEGEGFNSIISEERLQKTTTYKLNYEKNKFKRYSRLIDSTRFIHEEESPGVMVLFQNNRFSRKHKTQIEEFIRCLMEEERRKPYEHLPKLDLKSSAPSCSDLNDELPATQRTDKMWQAHAIIGCSHYYSEFMIDTLGWPLVEYNPSLTDSYDVPVYEQVYTDIFPVDEIVIKKKEERKKSSCWNCGGDHMLTDCKEPRNQQKINESRQAMMASKAQQSSSGPPRSARYHVETASGEPKYGALKPGVISQELREALGLQDNQLPLYIYKMRALGYPPGWMEDAKSDRVLSMIDNDGDEGTDDTNEEGGQLDVTKIIEYPGFTVETPDHFIDESNVYGMPPVQPHQLKATLMAHMEQQQQAMKRQLEESEAQEKKKQKLNTSDMDLDEDSQTGASNPPLPVDTPPSKPPIPDGTPPPTPDGAPVTKRSLVAGDRSKSPSLEELEKQYQLLQRSLVDEDVEDGELIVLDSCEDDTQSSNISAIEIDSQDDELPTDDSTGDTSKNPITLDDTKDEKVIEVMEDGSDREGSVEAKFAIPKIIRTSSTSSIQTFGELGTGSPGSSQPGTPQPGTPQSSSELKPPSLKTSLSISKDYGTPIMKRAGSVEVLPANKNFAEGIEDHIPFENLPDSTGTFEKMRSLIQKIRGKVVKRKK